MTLDITADHPVVDASFVSAPGRSGALRSEVGRSGFAPGRIVHLHPSARCNLSCSHCYSDSGPNRRDSLNAGVLNAALEVLRAQGYSHLSLSGGEPLMYPQLSEVVGSARQLGYRVTMITNGLLVNSRNEAVIESLDGLAVSFDGLAASHNAIRGRRDAFERATDAVRQLCADGHRVAAAVSVSRATMPELPDLVDHLVELGVFGVQIRPVALAGRASQLSAAADTDRARLYLISLALQREFPDVRISCDLAPAIGLWKNKSDYSDLLDNEICTSTPLAQLVNPLVITEQGTLKPIAYDFDHRFDIANVDSLTNTTFDRYKATDIAPFRHLIQAAIERLETLTTFVDWFDDCTRLSERISHQLMHPSLA